MSRPKGAKQTTKSVWSSSCLNCHATIKQQGSGRKKKWCNKKCHDNDPVVKAQKLKTTQRHYWKDRTPSQKWRRETNKQILVAEKLLRGEWDGVDEDPSLFKARVVATVEDMIARHPGGRVVVVCHGGVINQYLAHVLGIETHIGFFYPKYTSIHRVMAARSGQRSIVSINEASHLR